VRKFDPTTGAYLGKIAAAGVIDKPIQIVVSGDTLYIGNRGNESVARCDLRSGTVTPFILSKSGGLSNPSGLALGGDGFLYVAARTAKKILRFRLSDGAPDDRPFIDDLEDEPEFIALVTRG
jgi:sugar lactone lactonase YvrE